MKEPYKRCVVKDHEFIPNGKYRLHRVVMMDKLGRVLTSSEQVHHIDGDKMNNDPDNLQLFPDLSSHKLHHIRQDAFNATGDYNARKCKYCHEYDSVGNLYINKRNVHHRECHKIARRKYAANK